MNKNMGKSTKSNMFSHDNNDHNDSFDDNRYRQLTDYPIIARKRKIRPDKETQELIDKVLELEEEED